MPPFKGFPEGKVSFTPVPAPFFTELLPKIDHLGELKLTTYVFWRLDRMEGVFRCLRRADIIEDSRFMQGLGETPAQAETALDEALDFAVKRGTLLKATLELENGQESFYFLNSPKGRAALKAIQQGEWRPSANPQMPIQVNETPNIFRLYEEHIGPLTPLIAEALGEAEDTYPAQWIEDAFRIAVENNKRSWSYISAILRRWQEGGRDEKKDRRDTEEARSRYAEWGSIKSDE
jgi:DNA replication protein